uniref:Beta-lactamase n=1 Tax=Cyanothece sp. (strain PCC 7425 / ATCC 29141) TaxID=395961 RepID=B8HV34_CYAP4
MIKLRKNWLLSCLFITTATVIVPGTWAIIPASSPLAQEAADKPETEVTLQQVQTALVEMEKLAVQNLQKTGVPGMAIAVVYKDQIVYLKGFGVRQVGQPEPVDPDTVFQLASVSKPIAATVLARLVSEGVISWDDPIAKYTPEFQLDQPYVSHSVTLRDMFSHRSGLAGHAGDLLEDIGYSQAEVLYRLRFLPTANRFRAKYAYTNFGLTAAAIAAARAAGQPWDVLSANKLYRPLGMTSTSSRYADFMAASNRASGHVLVNGQWMARSQRQPDAQSPAGGVSSTVRDLAQWMRLQLAEGKFAGQQLIAPIALEETHRPQVISGYSAMTNRPSFYGLGWGVNYDDQGQLRLSHSGAFNLGAATKVYLLPAADLGIAVLTNSSPIGLPETIAESFADLVIAGRVQRDWAALFKQAFAAMITPQSTDYRKPPTPATPALPPSAYLGSYRNDYAGEIAIISQNGKLLLQFGPRKTTYPLRHYNRDLFTYLAPGENGGVLSGVTFTIGADGQASSVTLENFLQEGAGTFTRVTQ